MSATNGQSTNGSTAAPGTPRTGGEVVCDAMLAAGVDVIFGMPGGASLPFYDSLYHYQDRIRHVLIRHEQAAGFAANGYARATGKVGVATSTSGPGATNMVTCMANDIMDSVGVVYITGQVARPAIGSDAFQEADVTGISIPITKHSYLVMDVDDLPRVMSEAFHLASTGRPGPVHVDIPKDVFLETTTETAPDQVNLRGYRPSKVGNARMVRKAAEVINASERPIIMAGHGIDISGAAEELLQLATRGSIPVVSTLHGVGTFPETHPLSFGMLGMHGLAYANFSMRQTDCIIGLGTRFDDRAVGKEDEFGPGAKVVHIDIDPAEIGKVLETDVPIVGDLKLTLQKLLPLIESRDRTPWLDQMNGWRRDHPSLKIPDSPDSVLPQEVVRAIYDISGGEARVIADVGQNQMWASQHFWYERPRMFFSAGGLGPMGYALPAAMGVKLADESQDVWCVTGDGGLLINIQEFNTLAAEGINVKVAVLNNAHLGMIRQWQEFFYEGRYMGAFLDNPDFAKVAQAFGLHGVGTSSRDEMKDAIAMAHEYDGPVVLDLHVDRVENVYPMIVPGTGVNSVIEDPR
ncbi:MAG: biosynthetic-type acetolactate synthase large subunit [Chloroflexi bacterium]|nr:biosynthetic-type acetolactate synthase large subunit [Chloroflexota bacterium]MYD92824.1 biosynthetic-type acetolactate synthase large subunit [Chloroflexota bacterium]